MTFIPAAGIDTSKLKSSLSALLSLSNVTGAISNREA